MITKDVHLLLSMELKLWLLFALAFILVIPGTLYSQAPSDSDSSSSVKEEKNPFFPVEGMENWSHELDVEDLSPGIYNFIVEGTDEAGNTTFSDPINVYVDPESDKPVTGISNPESGMVVSGMLNIIGTATDDDGIARVEVKINDGTYSVAEGKEFWSFYLDTSSLDDGPCLLTVRSTDINGVQGDETKLSFVLDRSIPANEITSHKNGDLVHGKIKVEGKTSDGNRISKVEMSLDGETYGEVPLKQSRKESFGTFSFTIDTRDIEDGARIIWIRSTDKTGSIGLSSFLLFVDNNPPALDILYPGEDEGIDGHFTVVGMARDDIGLASLTCQVGRQEPVAVPLIPGDPYWTVPIDMEGEKKADIRFVLTDLTGNTVETRLQRDFDLDADMPVVTPVFPRPEEAYSAPVFAGFVSDDDGDVDVVYTLDGGEEHHIKSSYSFNIALADLSPGNHKLEYYGIDQYGKESKPVKIGFSMNGPAPLLELISFEPLEKGESLPFEQALELEPEKWKSLSGRVSFFNGAGTVSYSLDGSDEKSLPLRSDPSGDKIYKLSLKDVPAGYHSLLLHSVDKAGLNREKTFYFTIKGEEGNRLRYADDRFESTGALKQDVLVMEEKDQVTFYWEGNDGPGSVELSAEAPFLNPRIRDKRLVLTSTGPGFVKDLSITVVSKGGRKQVLGPYDIVADSKAPELILDMDKDVIQGPEEMTLSGRIIENEAFDRLTLSVNNKAEEILEIEGNRFEDALNMEGIGDGNVLLSFKALDLSGRSVEKYYLFRKDTAPPKLKQLAPLPGRGANGAVSFAGIADDPALLDSVEYSADGVQFVPLAAGEFIKTQLDLAPVEEGESDQTVLPRTIRLKDKAGNITLFHPEILIDTQGDKPVVIIQIPNDASLEQQDFTVSGMAFDDDKVASLHYRIDGGEERVLEGVDSFELPLRLNSLEDNEHLLEINAVDLNGIEGDWSSLSFRVSLSEPFSSMELPVMGESVNGVIDIQGYSEDPNGIDAVYISFDNGNSYDLMEFLPLEESPAEATDGDAVEPAEAAGGEVVENTEPDNVKVKWSYSYNTNLLKDGNHSILFKGVDRYGVIGLYTSLLTVDNTPPSLEIREPAEGVEFTNSIDLEGFLYDNGELARAVVEIQPLSDPEMIKKVDMPLDSLLRGSLDMSEFPDGWINLRITAEDVTGNVSHISRNIRKMESLEKQRVTIITPSRGSSINGDLLVQGMVENVSSIKSVQLFLDGSSLNEVEIKDSGYFSTRIEREKLTEGNHDISAVVSTEKGETIKSDISSFFYRKTGPWISLEGFTAGDYAANRPWLKGKAGYDYILPSLEKKELNSFEESKEVNLVEISLDNGKTFNAVSGREEWKYRLETQEIGNGELWIILRARFKDGTSALARTVLIVDETPPHIELLNPVEGVRFNDLALFTGTAGDDNGLKSIKASLREGNKNHYEVPEFIQGLFLDAHFLGSTFAEGGVGLTFFDDSVKLEALAGMAPDGRFNGAVAGVKLLANVASFPWDYFFGYDFANFSSSLAVGTTFQYFTMANSPEKDQSGMVLGAMLAQVELLNFNNPAWKRFSSFSFYMETQFWVISSDVEASISPRVAFGLRTNIF